MVGFEFGNFLGWYAFLALVPLILIYLIKPKPTSLKVPSLMFFMKHGGTSKVQSLFRRFQNDLLFLLQLLILALLAFSIVQPTLTVNHDVVSKNIVFVVDVSASSQVLEDGKTRLDIAKDRVKGLATSKNSLILLKSSPVVALENVGRTELVRYVNNLEPTDDISDVAAAIFLAGDLLAESNGRVVVVSDFIESKGIDADVPKNLLESRGIPVDFVSTKRDFVKNNVGIVDMVISGSDVNLYVKNYNNITKDVSLKINNNVNSLEVSSGSVEPFVFTLNSNFTSVEIEGEDDFMVDNKISITKPYSDRIKVLLVTNRPSRFLRAVLNSIEGVSLTLAEPPVISEEYFDLYVIDDANRNNVLVGSFGDIMEKVRDSGVSAIVLAQRDSNLIDYGGLLPLEFGEFVVGDLVDVNQVNRFSRDIEFGYVENVFEISGNGSNIVSVGNSSVVSLFDVGDGKVCYYGIMEEQSDFHLTPSYPIFWSNLVYSLVGREDLNEVNLKTGAIVGLGNTTDVLDKVGIYDLEGKELAVNLLNERESDLNFVDNGSSAEFVSGNLEKVKSDVDYNLEIFIAALVLILVLLEFVYIKYRGEI